MRSLLSHVIRKILRESSRVTDPLEFTTSWAWIDPDGEFHDTSNTNHANWVLSDPELRRKIVEKWAVDGREPPTNITKEGGFSYLRSDPVQVDQKFFRRIVYALASAEDDSDIPWDDPPLFGDEDPDTASRHAAAWNLLATHWTDYNSRIAKEHMLDFGWMRVANPFNVEMGRSMGTPAQWKAFLENAVEAVSVDPVDKQFTLIIGGRNHGGTFGDVMSRAVDRRTSEALFERLSERFP